MTRDDSRHVVAHVNRAPSPRVRACCFLLGLRGEATRCEARDEAGSSVPETPALDENSDARQRSAWHDARAMLDRTR